MPKLFSKWWFWLIGVLFIVVNVTITQLNDSDQRNENDEPTLHQGSINTH